MKIIYGVLALLGLAFSLSQLAPWIAEHGFSLLPFLNDARSSQLGAFAWTDKLFATAALFIFIVVEGGGRLRMRCIMPPTLATLLIGPSFGLPLFLLMREFKMEKNARTQTTNFIKQPA